MPELQEPRVISVERIDRQYGGYRFTGTVTVVWDPEAAERIKADMLAHMLRMSSAQLVAAGQAETTAN